MMKVMSSQTQFAIDETLVFLKRIEPLAPDGIKGQFIIGGKKVKIQVKWGEFQHPQNNKSEPDKFMVGVL